MVTGFGVLCVFAVIGALATVAGLIYGAVWLFSHVRFI
jgi:hypothetical protein